MIIASLQLPSNKQNNINASSVMMQNVNKNQQEAMVTVNVSHQQSLSLIPNITDDDVACGLGIGKRDIIV